MKKILLFFALLIGISFCLSASGKKEDISNVNLAVMSGPTGFSSCALDSFINVEVLPSPNEAVAKLVNGTLDMAVLPANKASILYNAGNKIKVIAIVGQGMLCVLGTDENSSEINVPGAGDTPDVMTQLFYNEYKRNYSISAPAQLAQMLIAEKVKLAILPQPFVNMAIAKNNNIKIFSKVKDFWSEETGSDQFPMSVLVVSESFAIKNERLIKKISDSYRNSVKWTVDNPLEAGKKIEAIGIMKADIASSAIKDCELVFIDGKEAEKKLNLYFTTLMKIMPSAIGNKIPGDDFYY